MTTVEQPKQQETSVNQNSKFDSSDAQSLSKEIERLCLEREKNMHKDENKDKDKINDDDLLWHYCSKETFLEIIKNKTIRLSDVTKSNDYTELLKVLSPLEELIKERNSCMSMLGTLIGKALSALCETDSKEKFLDKFLNDTSKEWSDNTTLEKARDILYKKIDGHVWGSSFTTKKDDLDMWRGYGNDASGLAIGYKKGELENFCKIHNINKYGKIVLTKVNYGENKAKDIASEAIDKLILKIDDLKNIEETPKLSEICADLGVALASCKDEKFKSEAEYRIVLSSICLNKSSEYNIAYRIRDDKFVSYIDLNIDDINNLIKKVYLGPKNNDKNKVEDIERLLKNYKCEKIQVEKSAIPYM